MCEVSADEAALAEWIRQIGLGFHPDTRGSLYVDDAGAQLLSGAECAELDGLIERLTIHTDIYELSLRVMQEEGLL